MYVNSVELAERSVLSCGLKAMKTICELKVMRTDQFKQSAMQLKSPLDVLGFTFPNV